MPKIVTPLNDKTIKSFKPKDKNYTKSDGQGLQMLIKTDGTKLWEFIYQSPTVLKRRKTSFGTYPTTRLQDARNKRTKFLQAIQNGIDPLEEKQNLKKKIKNEQNNKTNTFKKISLEWLEHYKSEVSENYHSKLERALELYTYSFIASKPINEITRLDIIDILQDLKNRDLKETANRIFMVLNKIFMYATMLEVIPHNIMADIDKKVILGKIPQKHYPTFTKEDDIHALLNAIDEYKGDYTTKMALKILPYTFVRSYNIRHCEWNEIDFITNTWTIPAKKMKTKIEFVLPLPNQVVSLLKELYKETNDSKYVFPSYRDNNRPMSDNTLTTALRRMGFKKEEFVPHSFRSMFSTIAYENANRVNGHSYTGEVIEALLAHKEKNKIKDAYNRASYKDAMQELIQWYANYLDEIKND